MNEAKPIHDVAKLREKVYAERPPGLLVSYAGRVYDLDQFEKIAGSVALKNVVNQIPIEVRRSGEPIHVEIPGASGNRRSRRAQYAAAKKAERHDSRSK